MYGYWRLADVNGDGESVMGEERRQHSVGKGSTQTLQELQMRVTLSCQERLS